MAAGPGGNEVGRISIRAVPDTSRFRQELKAKLEAIEEGLKVEVPIDPDTKGFRAKVKAATSNLPDAKVKVNADTRSLSRNIAGLFDKMPSVKLGTGINPAGYGVIAVALAATIAPALGLITTALAAVPGILAAIAAPIGAITLGIKGIGEAWTGILPKLQPVMDTMNRVNKEAFTPVFDKLAEVFPTVERALPGVSRGLAAMAGAFTAAAADPANLAKIESTISNIGTAFTRSAPGITGFTNGFINLANTLSQKFPAIADWFSEAGGDFDRFISKLVETGDLSDAFGGLGDNLKTIFDLVGDLGEQGMEFMGDPANIQRMADAFGNIATGIERIGQGSAKFFEVLDRIENSPTNRTLEDEGILGVFKEALNPNNLFGRGKGIEWGKIFSDQSGGKDAGNWFSKMFGADQDINLRELADGIDLGALWTKIKEGWDEVGVGMASASAENGAVIGQNLGQSIQKGLQSATQGGGGLLGTQAGEGLGATDQIAPAIEQAKAQIATIGPALQAALTPIQQVPAQIMQAFSGIGAAVSGSMANVVAAVAGAGSQIQAAFSASLAQLPAIAVQAFGALAGVATGAMAQVVAAITSGAAQGVAAVTSMGQQIVAALQSAASGAQAAGAAIGNGMAAGIRSSTGAAVAAAQALAAAVTAAASVKLGIKSPSKVFHGLGENTVQGFSDGISDNTQSAVDRARALADAITQAMNEGLTGIQTDQLGDQLKAAIKDLELQRKELKVQANEAGLAGDKDKKKGLQDEMAHIQALKDQLALQKDQLGISGEKLDTDKESFHICDELNKMISIGTGFADANLKQFQQDIGIGGNGAIPQLADIGVGWATEQLGKLITGGIGGGTTINVNSVDEAMQAKQTESNKKSLQYVQRGP